MATVALHHKIDGAGARIALLHPVGLDLTFLAPVAAELSRNFRVLSIDLRGHGRSPARPAPQGLSDYADDVHALFAAISFAPAAVIGFSFGGMVAQALALEHPQDVSALIPCACPATLAPENRRVARERAAAAERNGMAPLVEETLDRWFTEDFRRSGGGDAARARLESDDTRGWAEAWRAISYIDLLPRLNAVRAPTLCIAGEMDKPSPPDVVKRIADAIPGAGFLVLPSAPHMLFVEQPQAVAQTIADFLQGLAKL
jgi:3-oxoadipate enol-lactonase